MGGHHGHTFRAAGISLIPTALTYLGNAARLAECPNFLTGDAVREADADIVAVPPTHSRVNDPRHTDDADAAPSHSQYGGYVELDDPHRRSAPLAIAGNERGVAESGIRHGLTDRIAAVIASALGPSTSSSSEGRAVVWTCQRSCSRSCSRV